MSAIHGPGVPGGDHPGDLLSALLDDELGPQASADVEAHVAACTACSDDLAGLRRAQAALRGAPRLAAPPAFADDLVRARHRASRRGVAVALAAASVVVVAGLALAPTNPDTSPEHPSLALMSDAGPPQADLTPRTTTLVDVQSGDRVPVVPTSTEGGDDAKPSFADRVGGSARGRSRARQLRQPPPLQDPPPFTLGAAAPHTMIDAVGERVLEARLLDRARGTDPPGNLDAHAIAREEGGGGFVSAVAGGHPLGVHGSSRDLGVASFHVRGRRSVPD